ncbi:hypothetical protein HZH68_001095 [Vespula germanica]|uniref:Uncharacterized protein n=2 Tax=Vespula TaxID=7451 RepID=A0A834U6M6_VESGE|nr:hypothetical protein HZH66_001013 [Vespula vulgaris]KAF7418442.1 hypothetical protein HZH68_001095 [Vespula germanica]
MLITVKRESGKTLMRVFLWLVRRVSSFTGNADGNGDGYCFASGVGENGLSARGRKYASFSRGHRPPKTETFFTLTNGERRFLSIDTTTPPSDNF